MKKDTGIRVKYGVPYFIVRVMAIGMLFLILNTSNILAATESPVVLDLSLNQTTLEQVFRELEKQSGYSIIYKVTIYHFTLKISLLIFDIIKIRLFYLLLYK